MDGYLANTSYYYIDMEYCPETLESRILQEQYHLIHSAGGRIEILLSQFRSIINIAFDIGMGLAYIHIRGTVHRDLKPRNSRRQIEIMADLLVLFSQVSRCWKIADFGTASEATSKKFNTTQFSRGTSSYRAPEVLKENAKYNNKVDIWAFGCILYELSTGQKLFPNDWAVMEYVTKGALKFPLTWPMNVPVGVKNYAPKPTLDAYTDFSKNLLSTLHLVSSSRPKAQDLANTYYRALTILGNTQSQLLRFGERYVYQSLPYTPHQIGSPPVFKILQSLANDHRFQLKE